VSRKRFWSSLLLFLAAYALAAPPDTHAVEPVFPKGGFSVGVTGGISIIQMDDINRFIQISNTTENTRFDEFGTGWEVSADVRYALSKKIFLGLEAGYIWDESEDPLSGARLKTYGYPVLLTLGHSTKPDGSVVFRFLGGIGLLVNGTLDNFRGNTLQGTGFMGQLGGEVELRLLPAFGLTLVGVARTAKVADPEDTSSGMASPFDLDFSGAGLRLGLRGYIGGGRE
jgi:hypothetical protein